MAADISKNPVGSPQEHIKMCKSHELPIDIICEDCDEFICSSCVKTDHRDHDWKTIPSAATQRRRGLLSFLKKIKEDNQSGIEEKMEKMSKQWIKNNELCDWEIKKLQTHFDEIVAKLTEIKQRHEKTSRDNLVKKNNQLNLLKSELERKKKGIVEMVEFMEKYNSTMSDYSLIDNHRELTKMLSELDVHMTNCEHSVRFSRGEINDKVLESLFVKIVDLDDLNLTRINSFQYADSLKIILDALSEDQCYVSHHESENIEVVDKQGSKYHTYNITPNDMCVAESSDVYFTDKTNKSINCLSPSGSVSTVICTVQLVSIGICQSVDGGLLVTLRDTESDAYNLESHSRRLVKHIKVTGDVIHEYEYQEDGQTRLFTLPYRVTQNSNCDICVVNRTNDTKGELVIMSPIGQIKFIYHGKSLTKDFNPGNVKCDSLCNILVTDPFNDQIHLLSPDGRFLKFLLTDNEVIGPFALSLHSSTLWIGCLEGVVSVFLYCWRGGRGDHDERRPSRNRGDGVESRDQRKDDLDFDKKDDGDFGRKDNRDFSREKKRPSWRDRQRECSRQFRKSGASSLEREEKAKQVRERLEAESKENEERWAKLLEEAEKQRRREREMERSGDEQRDNRTRTPGHPGEKPSWRDREREKEDDSGAWRPTREPGTSSWREREKQRIDAWKKEPSPTKRFDDEEELKWRAGPREDRPPAKGSSPPRDNWRGGRGEARGPSRDGGDRGGFGDCRRDDFGRRDDRDFGRRDDRDFGRRNDRDRNFGQRDERDFGRRDDRDFGRRGDRDRDFGRRDDRDRDFGGRTEDRDFGRRDDRDFGDRRRDDFDRRGKTEN